MSQKKELRDILIERNEPAGIAEYLRWLETYRPYKTHTPVIAVDLEFYDKMFPQYYWVSGKLK